VIESHAAVRGDAVAIADGDRSISYRELNATANALARRLISDGFRRGMPADVCMVPSADLAIFLLAILKAGGHYRCFEGEPDDGPPTLVTNVGGIPRDVRTSPNLPVVTRPTDIACVLERGAGESPLVVPHATILSLAVRPVAERSPWTGETGAFDLWMALMSGATAVVSDRQAAAA
jgi:non-ribosomal peptide synthetase component F